MACRRLPPFVLAADGERLHQDAIHTQIERVRHVADASHQVVERSSQADLDGILAVERKVMTNRRTAARSERELVTRPVVLNERLRNVVGCKRRRHVGITHGELADLSRRVHVALHQGRRDREGSRNIVEALVLVVGREQRLAVNVQPEQIADRVTVLDPIQAVNGAATRIRRDGGRSIELGFEPRRQRFVRGAVGPRRAWRRHRPGAKLPHDLLPRVRTLADMLEVDRGQNQSGGPEPLVVTGDAILLEKPALGRDRPGSGTRGRSLRDCRLRVRNE